MDKAIVTCAITGVLTDPKVYPAPVTPEQMAAEVEGGVRGGRQRHSRALPQVGARPGPPAVLAARGRRGRRRGDPRGLPGVIVNQTTGTVGPDISGALACIAAAKPEIAALNAGSLNYLKTKSDGTWAWPPMLFDNPVEKIAAFLETMQQYEVTPEFECFDTGIVRTAAAIARNCGFAHAPKYNFVMGVESGMPVEPDLLPILLNLIVYGARWSVTAIGRTEIWPLHRRAAELGGDLRTGLEDTIYLPDGSRARSNGELDQGDRRRGARGGPRYRLARGGARRLGLRHA